MEASGYITLLLIVINVIVSYKGFKDTAFFYRYSFSPDKVLVMKDYKVLVTAGFLHVGWLHLFFNMFSLFAFSQALEPFMGSIKYLVIYFASLICGNLFVMVVNRYVAHHTVVGASGAVSGLIFASIALFPGLNISLFILPAIPAWLFGLIFVAYSIWGIRSGKDNIAHEGHLAGAVAGLIIACIMFPDALIENYVTVLLILVPSVVFIFFVMRNPTAMLVGKPFARKQQNTHAATIDHRYNMDKKKQQEEIDRILEKIHRKGMNSLTQKEKDILNGKQ